MKHLTEEQIQSCLDAGPDRCPDGIALHLKQCSRCRDAWEAQRNLIACLSSEPDFSLPDGFADRVVESIITGKNRNRLRIFGVSMIAVGVLLTAGYTWFILKGSGLEKYFEWINTMGSTGTRFWAILDSSRKWADSLFGGGSDLALAAAMALAIIALADRLIFKPVMAVARHGGMGNRG